MAPRIGLYLPTWPGRDGRNAGWDEIRTLAIEAEAAGAATLWVADHLQQVLPGRPPFGFWECWTILTAAATATSRVEVGSFVLATAFRNPGLVARMAATLDEVSGGRVILGLGSGDPAHDRTWEVFGYDAPRAGSRHAEAVEVIARLLREPAVTFAGEFHRTSGAAVLPPGPRRGGPPIWLAGKGSRTLATAARWGDAVNVDHPISDAADAVAIVERARAACEEVGRDPATLAVTGWARIAFGDDGRGEPRPGWLAGTVAELRSTLAAIDAAGVAHLTLYVGAADDPSPRPALSRASLDRVAPLLEASARG